MRSNDRCEGSERRTQRWNQKHQLNVHACNMAQLYSAGPRGESGRLYHHYKKVLVLAPKLVTKGLRVTVAYFRSTK